MKSHLPNPPNNTVGVGRTIPVTVQKELNGSNVLSYNGQPYGWPLFFKTLC